MLVLLSPLDNVMPVATCFNMGNVTKEESEEKKLYLSHVLEKSSFYVMEKCYCAKWPIGFYLFDFLYIKILSETDDCTVF